MKSKTKYGCKGMLVQNAAAFLRRDEFSGEGFKRIDRNKQRYTVCGCRHQKRAAAFMDAASFVTTDKERIAPVPLRRLHKGIKWMQKQTPPKQRIKMQK